MLNFFTNTQKTQYYKNYKEQGFFVVKNVFTKQICKSIIEEIGVAKNTYKYYDRKNLIRRIENIYNKGTSLRLINKNLIFLLNEIFNKEYTIFKDKYNAKPPGGEGFYAHYDGVFQFRNKVNKLENGWYKYGKDFVNILVALDPCNKINGSIEISKVHKNNSLSNRRTLYYTYSLLKFGSKYKKYFQDKILSKNKNSKSLSGEI